MSLLTTTVLVFRTNITEQYQKQKVLDLLFSFVQVTDCSLDSEDVDKVLRVVSCEMTANEIISLVAAQGFECKELE